MKTIDLNPLTDYKGHYMSIYDTNLVKSNKLITEVIRHRNQTGQNFMIVPMSIYNLLESNPSFNDSKTLESQPNNLLIYAGSIFGIEVYLDLYLPSDTIILKYDKSVMRDKKIDSILNDAEIKEEVEIRVLNYYLNC